MDTDSSFPDTPRYGTEELEGMWPQQTFCQGSDNLQPADCVLLPVQGGYRFGNQARGHPTSLRPQDCQLCFCILIVDQ
ncbi:MAG: hypothetical protein QOI53_4512 [Verrucomicrobiota bacterium]|jgi:hypothetical protein|nr:hypothetical protein [Verrucomicrobiota bacterium]